jgi:hypothetical protein
MSTARKLRAVAAPSPIPATPARAAAVYPQSEHLAAQWLAAVRWMQGRPGGSRWVLDKEARAPRWRASIEDVPYEHDRRGVLPL